MTELTTGPATDAATDLLTDADALVFQVAMTLGRATYNGYRTHSDGKSLVSGQPISVWESLPKPIQEAWIAAGHAAASFVVCQAEAKIEADLMRDLDTQGQDGVDVTTGPS